MRRLRLLVLIGLGLAAFLVASAVLARGFSVDGAERSAITALVQSQARGDASAMTRQIHGCSASAACRARVTENAAALRRTGKVTILQLNPSAGFSVSSTVGTARVAWRAADVRPIVQCVRVRRAGNVISGLHVELLELSRRIKGDATCPARY